MISRGSLDTPLIPPGTKAVHNTGSEGEEWPPRVLAGPSRWRRTDVEKTSVRQRTITAGREKLLRSFVLLDDNERPE
jgi:hypothetical protein